jgi:putative transposase
MGSWGQQKWGLPSDLQVSGTPAQTVRLYLAGVWPRSSYRATVGDSPSPDWLFTDWLLSQFAKNRSDAQARFRPFVHEGASRSPWTGLRKQIYLGDENFVERMQAMIGARDIELNVPKAQRRRPAPSLTDIANQHPDRDAAIAAAYATGAYTYREIASFFGLHPGSVGRIIRRRMYQCDP